MSYLKKLPWTQFGITVGLSIVFYAYTAHIQAEIRDQLTGYETKVEAASYQQTHRELTEEVVKRIDGSLRDIKQTAQDTNAMLKEMMNRRPPPPPPMLKAN